MIKAERRRERRGSRKKTRGKEAKEKRKEKTKKEKNNEDKESSRGMENLEWRRGSGKVRRESKEVGTREVP